MKISVAIPSYQREQVLLDTIEQVLALDTLPLEILVVDQTPIHGQNVEEGLQALAAEERIHWLRL
ncbi:MAG: glycosyltransferase family 2 protein, partial [Desulfobulbus sp.]